MNRQTEPSTVYEIVQRHAEARPDAEALVAPGRSPLSYSALLVLVEQVGRHLGRFGISSSDRVAIVMPNGPEMAAVFLSVSSAAAAAPLNPVYREAEFRFYLSDLEAKALVVEAESGGEARDVARSLGMAVIEVQTDRDAPAGMFSFGTAGSGEAGDDQVPVEFSRRDDTALLLHTSGTTARPKLVPLSHRNLCAAVENIAKTIRLTPDDRGLNVMPLFHVHGLVGSILSTLWAGGSTVCTPGFSEGDFFDWVNDMQPTWYSAVPTMHQAVVRAARSRPEQATRTTLRLVRSASWALAPSTAQELTDALQVPVVEAYGMTEASNQICCNPLPPGRAKFGSVGPPAGPDVAVMGAEGQVLAQGKTGEVVIRGACVTGGYENNRDANAQAFVDGWFRTGDEGAFDEDGYLFLKGRIKEIINRGGENVSPREIDEALLEHPSVQQAVAFAVRHPSLGEDIAAAVVPAGGATISEGEMRAFAFGRLAAFKVPSRVVIVDEIPKGPTGKIQRLRLAEALDDRLLDSYQEPAGEVETAIVGIWQEVLGVDRVGAADNFFALGGDSLRGTQVLSRVRSRFGVELPVPTIFFRPTVTELAGAVSAAVRDASPAT